MVGPHVAVMAGCRSSFVDVARPGDGPANQLGSCRRLARRLKELQDVLGEHQDAIVAEQLLRDYGMRAHLDNENGFTCGLLLARQRGRSPRDAPGLTRATRRLRRTDYP